VIFVQQCTHITYMLRKL